MRIREILQEQGKTTRELAEMLGITISGLNQILSGKPTLSSLERIAEALQVPMWQLFASPIEVTREEGALLAVVNCKGHTYTANSLSELKTIVAELEML